MSDRDDYLRQQEAIRRVINERNRQDAKWGRLDRQKVEREPAVWLAILAEEVGEAAQALLQGPEYQDLFSEVEQITAVGLAWMEVLLDGGPTMVLDESNAG